MDAMLAELFLGVVLVRQVVAGRLHRRRQVRFAQLLRNCEAGFGPVLAAAARLNSDQFSAEDADHWSPLIMASKGGHAVLVSWMLVEAGVDNANPRVNETHTALRAAALGGHTRVCELLLDVGKANIDQFSAFKRTPLMGASMNGHADTVAFLLKRGANPRLVRARPHSPARVRKADRAFPAQVNSTGERALQLAKNDAVRRAFDGYDAL